MVLSQLIKELQGLMEKGIDSYTEVVLNQTPEKAEHFALKSIVDVSAIEVDGYDEPLIMISSYNPEVPDADEDIHLELN